MKLLYSSKILKNSSVTIGGQIFIDSKVVIEPEVKAVTDESRQISEADAENIADIIINLAQKEAESILDQGKAQVEALRSQLLEENEYLKRKTFDETKEQAYKIGYDEGKQCFLDSIRIIEEKSRELTMNYENLLLNSEREVLEMIFAIVRKVVNDKVIVDAENVKHLISEAISYCNEKNSSVIKVSASDFKYIKDHYPEMFETISGYLDAQIRPDLSLKEGSCIVNSSNGIVDLSIDTRLEKIIEDINISLS